MRVSTKLNGFRIKIDMQVKDGSSGDDIKANLEIGSDESSADTEMSTDELKQSLAHIREEGKDILAVITNITQPAIDYIKLYMHHKLDVEKASDDISLRMKEARIEREIRALNKAEE